MCFLMRISVSFMNRRGDRVIDLLVYEIKFADCYFCVYICNHKL